MMWSIVDDQPTDLQVEEGGLVSVSPHVPINYPRWSSAELLEKEGVGDVLCHGDGSVCSFISHPS